MLIYLVGQWDSLDQHIDGFIPSDANQELLESLKGCVSVEWFFHLHVEGNVLPMWEGGGGRGGEEKIWRITRFVVKVGQKEKFMEVMAVEGRGRGGGWKVERGGGGVRSLFGLKKLIM